MKLRMAVLLSLPFLAFSLNASSQPGAPSVGKLAETENESIRTRTLAIGGGSLIVEVTSGGEAAIREIHRQRDQYYRSAGGKTLQEIDSQPKVHPDSSFFLKLNRAGVLKGLIQRTDLPYQPFKHQIYELPAGSARVVFSAATDSEGELLAVSYYNVAGRLSAFGYVRAFEDKFIALR